MKNLRQILSNIFVLVVLIAFTFLIIFNNFDFNKTIEIVLDAKLSYILIAIFCMSLYYVFEGISIRNVLNNLGENVSLLKAIKYTYIGFFFSGITPAASGGQPMEIYYMNQEKIKVNHGALAMLVHLISYQIVIIILGLIGFMLNSELLEDSLWIFYAGLSLNLLAITLMLIGVFYPKFSRKLVRFVVKIMKFFKSKNIEKNKERIDAALKEYTEGAKFIKSNFRVFGLSILMAFFQMICYYSVVYFVYRSFGLSEYNYIELLFIQTMLFISVSSIPLPGSVGVSETVFLKIYETIFGLELLPSAMIINRGINFYLFITICAIVVIVNTIYLKIKKPEK